MPQIYIYSVNSRMTTFVFSHACFAAVFSHLWCRLAWICNGFMTVYRNGDKITTNYRTNVWNPFLKAQSLNANVNIGRKFWIMNPSDAAFSFVWECEDPIDARISPSFACHVLQGTIEPKKKTEVKMSPLITCDICQILSLSRRIVKLSLSFLCTVTYISIIVR